jgi:hypothetical protein
MRTKRTECNGNKGHLAIERKRGNDTIRIDSIIRDRDYGEQTWKVWELPAAVSDEELFKIATELQYRTDGNHGNADRINEFLGELKLFKN